MMTRKDYVEVAKIIAKHSKGDECRLDTLTEDFAFWFAEDNPRFNMEKFLEACNGQSNDNNRSTIFSWQRFYFIPHDVTNAKRRLARNKKRFAKVDHDPKQDLKLLEISTKKWSACRPQAVDNLYVACDFSHRV